MLLPPRLPSSALQLGYVTTAVPATSAPATVAALPALAPSVSAAAVVTPRYCAACTAKTRRVAVPRGRLAHAQIVHGATAQRRVCSAYIAGLEARFSAHRHCGR